MNSNNKLKFQNLINEITKMLATDNELYDFMINSICILLREEYNKKNVDLEVLLRPNLRKKNNKLIERM